MTQQHIDIASVRADTPGCLERVHLNNAGSSLPPRAVTDAVIGYIRDEARYGGYEVAAREAAALRRPYEALATLLNGRPGEVAIVESATRGWGSAFFGFRWKEGDRLITGRAEYASNFIAFLQVRRWHGVEIDIADDDWSGATDPASVAALIRPETRLIAITHVPTNGGLVNPAEAIGAVAKDAGVPYLLDACQSVGQLDLDVERIGCDILSGTGRKYLRAPRGTGFVWVRQSLLEQLEPPLLDLHGGTWTADFDYRPNPDASRFEHFEGTCAGKAGLGVAIDYALGLGMPAIEARVRHLAGTLRDRLSGMKGVRLTDIGSDRCGIVTFTKEGMAPAEIRSRLAGMAINVSVSARSSTLLDMERRNLEEVVRASVHYYNDEADLDRFATALDGLAA